MSGTASKQMYRKKGTGKNESSSSLLVLMDLKTDPSMPVEKDLLIFDT